MSFYPEAISERFYETKRAGKAEKTNAIGTSASFVCGSFVRFFLEIEPETKTVKDAKFNSNGCGFAIAAADFLAEKIIGLKLTELHGLEDFRKEIEGELGRFEENRQHCLEICLEALQQSFADFRTFQIEEFSGEKALICTCFGVSEEQIEMIIEKQKAETVEEVGQACNAGTGCGSCQFLIQELLDAKDDIFKL